jgi:hypothetical protein
MDHIQYMLNVMMEAGRSAREDYHVKLGDAIDILAAAPGDTRVNLSNKVDSYRGYYEDLAIEPGESTASELHAALSDVIDTKLEGYKGGEYLMTVDTPLWEACYGSTGDAIVGIDVEVPGEIRFIFKNVD